MNAFCEFPVELNNQKHITTLLRDIIGHVANIDTGGIAIISVDDTHSAAMTVAAKIHRSLNLRVLVIEPHLLHIDRAVANLAALSYAVTDQNNKAESTSLFCQQWQQSGWLKFATYHQVLNSDLLRDADILILNESQGPSQDVALSKALLKQRLMLEKSNPCRVILVQPIGTPVVDELVYWKDFRPKPFLVLPDAQFDCVRRWEPTLELHTAALNLVDEGRSGILVFVPSQKEVKDTTDALVRAILNRSSDGRPIEVAMLNWSSDSETQQMAFTPPENNTTKILVGTMAICLGDNMTWVDAGVSSGTYKQRWGGRPYVDLMESALPKILVEQQVRTISRFHDGVFVHCGSAKVEDSPTHPMSEITSLPLTELVLRCASLGIDPLSLDFLPSPDPMKLRVAQQKLRRLDFIDIDQDQSLRLTASGRLLDVLPVGLEAAALLCHAGSLGILDHALILAAVLENGSIRHDRRLSHGFDTTSDLVDEALAFAMIYRSPSTDHRTSIEEMKSINVDWRQFDATLAILRSCERQFRLRTNCIAYVKEEWQQNTTIVKKLRQCILAASLDNLGYLDPSFESKKMVILAGCDAVGYQRGNSTTVAVPKTVTPISATLRTIIPHNAEYQPFPVAENITVYQMDDFKEFNEVRPGVFSFPENPDYEIIQVFGVDFYTRLLPLVSSTTTPISLDRIVARVDKTPRKTKTIVPDTDELSKAKAIRRALAAHWARDY